jgi:hypothetical protein
MSEIAQIIADLAWGLTFGALIAVATLAAQAAGAVAAGCAALGLGWHCWRKLRRR